MYKSKNDMSYEQVKTIMLEHGLEEYDDSEGTNFKFVKGKKHIKIFERFKPMIRGGITGNLYVEVLEDYKTLCSINGHINIKLVQDEKELRNILDSVKKYYLRKITYIKFTYSINYNLLCSNKGKEVQTITRPLSIFYKLYSSSIDYLKVLSYSLHFLLFLWPAAARNKFIKEYCVPLCGCATS